MSSDGRRLFGGVREGPDGRRPSEEPSLDVTRPLVTNGPTHTIWELPEVAEEDPEKQVLHQGSHVNPRPRNDVYTKSEKPKNIEDCHRKDSHSPSLVSLSPQKRKTVSGLTNIRTLEGTLEPSRPRKHKVQNRVYYTYLCHV